jgi:hypothetical protein
MKPCPLCAEAIQDSAIKCRFCGSMLDADPATTVAVQQQTPSIVGGLHQERLWIVLWCIGGMISAFLPWVKAPFVGSVSGVDGTDGWLVVVVFAVGLFICLSGDQRLVPPMGARAGVLLSGLAAVGIAAWKISDVYKLAASGNGEGFGGMSKAISVGAGLYVMLAAGVALAGAALRTSTGGSHQQRPKSVAVSQASNSMDSSIASYEKSSFAADSASDAEAARLIKRAQSHQYERQFDEARALYEEVVARFPEFKQATMARQQIKNLR